MTILNTILLIANKNPLIMATFRANSTTIYEKAKAACKANDLCLATVLEKPPHSYTPPAIQAYYYIAKYMHKPYTPTALATYVLATTYLYYKKGGLSVNMVLNQ